MISFLLSVLLVVCYGMALHTAFTGEEVGSFSWYSYKEYQDQNIARVKAFTVIILIMGCFEFLLCVGSMIYVAYAYQRDKKRDQNKVRQATTFVQSVICSGGNF